MPQTCLREKTVKRSEMVPTYSATFTGCYTPAVPAGDVSNGQRRLTVRNG
jgi:hypothetical protein